MKQAWRSYTEAKAFVHSLGLKNRHEWREYCRSGQRPVDIPSSPSAAYGEAFEGMGMWIGKVQRTVKKRPFPQARSFIQSLKLQSGQEWKAYCRSGNKPTDIPADPRNVYHKEFVSMGDWLGTDRVASQYRTYRPFPDARAFVQALGLQKEEEWIAYCRSGNKPDDIPRAPRHVYGSAFVSLGDWLGTGSIASYKRTYRSFEEARAYARSLHLKGYEEWKTYCRSGNKPNDIPANPDHRYKPDFRGWGDWLGTGNSANFNRVYRSFSEARIFAQSLTLKNGQEWKTYCQSGQKPDDIPANPDRTYRTEFRGMGDWLGTTTLWNRAALLSLLEDLRPHLRSLRERELYIVLQAGGALPALRIALEEPSTLTVLRRVLTQEERVLQKIQTVENDEATCDVQGGEINTDEDVPEGAEVIQQGLLNDVLDETSQQNTTMDLESSTVMHTHRKEHLHLVDHLARLPGALDDESAEYLVTSRVSSLWEVYSHEGQQAIDALFGEEEGGQFFSEIKRRFLAEVEAVERLDWTEGWAFTVNGNYAEPNVMQRRIAWLVREYRRIGNWSGVGSGKTISALLSSRICHMTLTLIITNYPTISGWVQSIRNVYPDSEVSTDPQAILASDSSHYRYLVLNYEKFQNAGRQQLVQQLLTLGIQFIVLDEIQLVKQRETKISQRSKAVQTLIRKASQHDPHLRVLGMSATPIINSLLEGKHLLETTIGASFSELRASPTIANALAMHRALMCYGFRFRPRYEQEMHTRLITVKRNDLLPALERAQSSILAMEQSVLPAKLDVIGPYLRPGTLIYTHYIEGMLPLIQQHLASLGFSMGFYTGSDKSGLQLFLDDQVEILVGSSAVGTGLDGLQQRCDQIILLSLPWTSAAMEQIIGRARRQGSQFQQIEIVIPQVTLEKDGEVWSWDVQRWNMLQLKRTLSDCVLDGRIPDMIRLDEQTLLHQSSQALQRWIGLAPFLEGAQTGKLSQWRFIKNDEK